MTTQPLPSGLAPELRGAGGPRWEDFFLPDSDVIPAADDLWRRFMDKFDELYLFDDKGRPRTTENERGRQRSEVWDIFREAAAGNMWSAARKDPRVAQVIAAVLPDQRIIMDLHIPAVFDAWKAQTGRMPNESEAILIRNMFLASIGYRTQQQGQAVVRELMLRPGVQEAESVPLNRINPFIIVENVRLAMGLDLERTVNRARDFRTMASLATLAPRGEALRQVVQTVGTELAATTSEVTPGTPQRARTIPAGIGVEITDEQRQREHIEREERQAQEDETQRLFEQQYGSPMSESERAAWERIQHSALPGLEEETIDPSFILPSRLSAFLYSIGMMKESVFNRQKKQVTQQMLDDWMLTQEWDNPTAQQIFMGGADKLTDEMWDTWRRHPNLLRVPGVMAASNYLSRAKTALEQGIIQQTVGRDNLIQLLKARWQQRQGTNALWNEAPELRMPSDPELNEMADTLYSELVRLSYQPGASPVDEYLGNADFGVDPNLLTDFSLAQLADRIIDSKAAPLVEQAKIGQSDRRTLEEQFSQDLLQFARQGANFDQLDRLVREGRLDLAKLMERAQANLRGTQLQDPDTLVSTALTIGLQGVDDGLKTSIEETINRREEEAVGQAFEQSFEAAFGSEDLQRLAQAIGDSAGNLIAPFTEEVRKGLITADEAVARALERNISRIPAGQTLEGIEESATKARQQAQQFDILQVQIQGQDDLTVLQNVLRVTGGDQEELLRQVMRGLPNATPAQVLREAITQAATPLTREQRLNIVGGAGPLQAALERQAQQAAGISSGNINIQAQLRAAQQLPDTFQRVLASFEQARAEGRLTGDLAQAGEAELVQEAKRRAEDIVQQETSQAMTALGAERGRISEELRLEQKRLLEEEQRRQREARASRVRVRFINR